MITHRPARTWRPCLLPAHQVNLLRARDLDVGVGERLAPVRQVARHARHRKQHGEELRREAHGAVHQPCAGACTFRVSAASRCHPLWPLGPAWRIAHSSTAGRTINCTQPAIRNLHHAQRTLQGSDKQGCPRPPAAARCYLLQPLGPAGRFARSRTAWAHHQMCTTRIGTQYHAPFTLPFRRL